MLPARRAVLLLAAALLAAHVATAATSGAGGRMVTHRASQRSLHSLSRLSSLRASLRNGEGTEGTPPSSTPAAAPSTAGDKTTGDKTTGDKATGDKATGNKATSDEATSTGKTTTQESSSADHAVEAKEDATRVGMAPEESNANSGIDNGTSDSHNNAPATDYMYGPNQIPTLKSNQKYQVVEDTSTHMVVPAGYRKTDPPPVKVYIRPEGEAAPLGESAVQVLTDVGLHQVRKKGEE